MSAPDGAPLGPERRYGPITRTDIVRHAGACGDFNPIHHDDVYAASIGLPSPFAMGTMQGGMLGAYVADCVGADNVRGFRLRYRGQVWPGDQLVFSGRLAAERADGTREYELSVTTGDGRVVVTGTATVRG